MTRKNQLPLISAVPTRSENAATGRNPIFGDMVMQRDDPAGARISVERGGQAARLSRRHHAERVGEGEIAVRVGIEQDDAEPVVLGRRDNLRERLVPDPREPGGALKSARVGESLDLLVVRPHRFSERQARRL